MVGSKIQDSKNLNSLISTLEDMHSYMEDKSIIDKYNREKLRLDDKIQDTRFTYVMRRKEEYNELIEDIEADNGKLKICIEKARSKIDTIFEINQNVSIVDHTLNNLASKLIKIDESNPHFGEVHDAIEVTSDRFAEEIAEELKEEADVEQKEYATDKLGRYYQIRDGELICKTLGRTNRVKESTILKMSKDRHFQKVLTVPQEKGNERVFLIGGSSDDEGSKAVDTCTEVILGTKKKTHQTDIQSMIVPRLSFCACVDQKGTQISTAGGIGDNRKPTNDVEVYDIEQDEWTELPSLNQPRFSATIISSGTELFCMGGQDTDQTGKHFSLNSIEWIDLSQDDCAWEVSKPKLPWKTCSPGAMSLRTREILIFGGWNEDLKKEACVLKGNSSGDFHVKKHSGLEEGDTFLFQGIRKRNFDDLESIIFGHEYVHLYNEVEKSFTLI